MIENSLLQLHPDLSQQWDPEKNGTLTPADILCGSNKKVWWRCSKGHEWQAVVVNRVKGSGCPYCAGQRAISGQNDLATLNPKLAKEWHPIKNDGVLPSEVMPKSNKKYWWLCPACNCEWQDTVSHRSSGRTCPQCNRTKNAKKATERIVNDNNRLSTNYPEIAKEWNYVKNGDLQPNSITIGSSRKVWWICEKGHEWQDSPAHRCSRGNGCPYCSNHKVKRGFNDLATTHPSIAAEWNKEKNEGLTPFEITAGSNRKVWWVCKECGFEWQTYVASRTSESLCPRCMNIRRGQEKSYNAVNEKSMLSRVAPHLAASWDVEKNGTLTPDEVSAGSNRKVWWKCEKGHEWQASIVNRIKGRGCPFCGNKKVLLGFNDLQTTFPEIAREWNYRKNGDLKPTEVTYGSNKKVWWKCERGHEWCAQIVPRTTKGIGCPECTKYSRSSFPEQALFYYIKQCYPDAINSYKECFERGMEIDIFIPTLNLGIEYDGILHEYESDLKKYRICKENHIILMRIKEFSTRYPQKTTDNDVCDILIYVKESSDLIDVTVFDRLKTYVQLPDHIDVERDRLKIYAEYLDTKKDDSLEIAFPNIVKEWHPTKNGDIQPNNIYKGSTRKFWWICEKGHEWEEKVNVRTHRGTGCPYCSSHRLLTGFNDLATVYPDLAAEWHPDKNEEVTPQMCLSRSGRKVWWKCKKGHEWQAIIGNRAKGAGCPFCAGRTPSSVVCVETGMVYLTYAEAARSIGLSSGDGISAVCKGKQNTAGGFHWKFME